MAEFTFPCGLDEIKQVLPHREPFIWVSRILECSFNERCVAELDVDPELDIFRGHFPGHPVLPGVILMEALAQTSCFCLLGGGENAGKLGFFATPSASSPPSPRPPSASARPRSRPTSATRLPPRHSRATCWGRSNAV